MKKLEFLVQVLGMVGTNTYTCFHKENRECIIVDPADEASEIMKQISQNVHESKKLPSAADDFEKFAS